MVPESPLRLAWDTGLGPQERGWPWDVLGWEGPWPVNRLAGGVPVALEP